MHIPDGEFEAVSEAAHRVLREAKSAGIYVSGGGLQSQQATIVDPDGSVRLGGSFRRLVPVRARNTRDDARPRGLAFQICLQHLHRRRRRPVRSISPSSASCP